MRAREKVLDESGTRRTMNNTFKGLWACIGRHVFSEWDSFEEFGLEEVTFIKK